MDDYRRRGRRSPRAAVRVRSCPLPRPAEHLLPANPPARPARQRADGAPRPHRSLGASSQSFRSGRRHPFIERVWPSRGPSRTRRGGVEVDPTCYRRISASSLLGIADDAAGEVTGTWPVPAEPADCDSARRAASLTSTAPASHRTRIAVLRSTRRRRRAVVAIGFRTTRRAGTPRHCAHVRLRHDERLQLASRCRVTRA